MKKTTIIYLLVLFVGAAGLWVILRLGNRLQAAADLTGTWTLQSGLLGPDAGAAESLGEGFEIDQSGQFFRIRFSSGRRMNLRARQLPRGIIGQTPVEVDLGNDRWQLKGTVRQQDGRLMGNFHLTGPRPARFAAYRDPPTAAEPPPPIEPELPAVVIPATQAAAAPEPTAPATIAEARPVYSGDPVDIESHTSPIRPACPSESRRPSTLPL